MGFWVLKEQIWIKLTWFLDGELPLPTGFICCIEAKRAEICFENTTSKPLINHRKRQLPMRPCHLHSEAARSMLEMVVLDAVTDDNY